MFQKVVCVWLISFPLWQVYYVNRVLIFMLLKVENDKSLLYILWLHIYFYLLLTKKKILLDKLFNQIMKKRHFGNHKINKIQ